MKIKDFFTGNRQAWDMSDDEINQILAESCDNTDVYCNECMFTDRQHCKIIVEELMIYEQARRKALC